MSQSRPIDPSGDSWCELATMLERGNRLRSIRFAPTLEEFNQMYFEPSQLERVCVIEVTDPLNFVFRTWGPALTELHKCDMTVKNVREIQPPQFGAYISKKSTEIVLMKLHQVNS